MDARVRELVKATIPVLKEHGVALTTYFYQRMFRHNPELKNIFNQSHNETGKQPVALAMAVLAYAENIDDPSVLAPVITLIANKHASVGIRAEHYPIVGKHLLASIGEVLGDAVTPAIAAAWDEAYWLLAVELIALEARLYQQAAHAPGNWRALRVVRKQRESELVTSFYLQAADAGALPAFRPGQYVSVALNLESLQRRQIRQYSLSDAPGQGWWRISVKRETAGAATPAGMISNLLHDEVGEGDVLQVSPPFGDFVLDEASDAPVVLLSAGVGVTPLASMLKQLRQCQPTRQVTFAHAARDGRHHALKQELAAECGPAALHTAIFYEQPDSRDRHGVDYHFAGRMQLDRLAPEALCADADYYLCGPLPFMREQRRALLERGIDPQQIRYEVFGPELLGALN